PTSMPMNTSMSAWLVIMSLIFFDSCGRTFWLWFGWPVVLWLQGSASTLRLGSRHGFCQWFWPLSAISLVPSSPGDYTPADHGDWGHQSCRGSQASDPFLS